jgi:TonB family protein
MAENKDDIEKYLAGKLSPAERHALERNALTDPFLADALEGAESISPEEFSLDLNELNQKIIKPNRSKWFWPMRIAASVVGIALVSTAIFLTVRDDQENNLASSKNKEQGPSPSLAKKDSLNERDSASASGGKNPLANSGDKIKDESVEESKTGSLIAENKEPAQEKPKESRPVVSNDANQSLVERKGSGANLNQPIVTESQTVPVTANDSILQGFVSGVSKTADEEVDVLTDQVATLPSPDIAKSKRSERALAEAKKSQPVNLVVTGQVRDQQGQPLPGVNITAKNYSAGTTTDANGKYSIALNDPNPVLVYSFIGFVAQEQSVDKNKADDLNIQLQEDAMQLSEVVVTGYGTQKTSDEPVVRLAEPQGGRKAYDQYLEDKKVYPIQALENKIEGKVVIEFTVTTAGLLTDFNVVRKLGYGCDEEIIRLIKEGPQWRPSYIDNEAVESLVRVKTKFDLKGKR